MPTIVIGQAEGTAAKTSTPWVITLLHEHFHQLQYARPRYITDVDALGLARGEQTGMWMLNYPFPYTDAGVKDGYAGMAKALATALRSRQQPDFADKLTAYLDARTKFSRLLTDDDRKYLAFQAWQEGIARYTEYHVARLAAEGYEPSPEFRGLKDYTPFKDEAAATLKRIERELDTLELDKAKRVVVYALGAADGLLLDRANPGWRKRYFEERFSLDGHFRAVKKQ